MSGKPKRIDNPKWGGKREGSGRKPRYMMPDYQINEMMKTARRVAKERNKTLDEVLIEIAYGEYKATVANRLAAINIYKGFTLPKSSEQNINVKRDVGPSIGLPPVRGEDPALKVVKG